MHLVVEQVKIGARRLGRNGLARNEGSIQGRDALRDQSHAQAVHTDVVIAGVPKIAIRRHSEQRVGEERTLSQIDRARQFLTHPRFRRGLGVGLCADIEHREEPIRRWLDILLWPFIGLKNTQVQGVRFGHGLTQSCLKAFRLNRPLNIMIFRHVVHGILGDEHLGKPNAGL